MPTLYTRFLALDYFNYFKHMTGLTYFLHKKVNDVNCRYYNQEMSHFNFEMKLYTFIVSLDLDLFIEKKPSHACAILSYLEYCIFYYASIGCYDAILCFCCALCSHALI